MFKLSNRACSARLLLGAAVAIAAVGTVSLWPVTTAVGSDHHVTLKRLTLFEKAVAFVDRELETRRLTAEIAGSDGTPEQRLLRMYEWVAANIHPVPPGLPLVDDHIWNIFVRRYGAIDQRAEALAVIASYDGMPAARVPLGKTSGRRAVQLTIVQLGERVVVFDVNNRIAFRKASGELATLNDLKTDFSLIERNGGDLIVDGSPYVENFREIRSYRPSFVRMEKQRLLPRLKDELLEHIVGS
jgi:hypothetical protein